MRLSEHIVVSARFFEYRSSEIRGRFHFREHALYALFSQNTSEMEAGNPEGHQVESAEGVEGRIYRCKLCPYVNKTKYGFTRHMLVHKDISEVTAHRCELCPYMAKRKYDLTVHMLIHKDPSETPTYDCNLCSFKAIRKYTLKDHMLIHKNAYTREATVHQCALCPYKTKGKSNMTSHMQTHVTYDCDKCSFKTKLKRHLTRHMLIHKDDSKNPSEMETEDPNGLQVKPVGDLEKTHFYRCKLCPYKSKLRKCWTKHMLNHKDISENASETETGNPKSPRVESVKDVEGTIYRCKLCPYKTQIKRYLTTHMFVHKDISEVKAHRCTLCPYKAKRKCGLTKHMLTHKDISEVTTYDCNLCSYKAKRKQSLSHHMMIHIDSSKDAKSAQTRQERMSEHQELEGCSIIKLEEVDIKDEEDE
ncbi:hypothetical protein NQ318_000040 [Aromia moschata]|uniref:C2H2-type domain-containing protein n=1 Tax=Aromia moschata TaxID=1265417 RepID=A0AAV8YCH7_9CUCU|nr:hypothetical protein NQ318_000040 [Aromia moschata]